MARMFMTLYIILMLYIIKKCFPATLLIMHACTFMETRISTLFPSQFRPSDNAMMHLFTRLVAQGVERFL